jgi:hypothetical protein
MNLSALQIGTAFQLMIKTLPILLVRLGVSILFWLAALLYLAIVGGISYLIGQAVDWLGFIVFIVALGGMAALYNLAYRYVFYMIKAAHIAVISEILVNGKLPDGVNQLAWGKQRVTERFGETNVMFVIDELVTGVVRAFTGTVYTIASWLPGDTLRTLVQVLNTVIRFALSSIDEAILARRFYAQSDSPWTNARDGLVLYGMVWKPILINAVALMVISYIPFLVALLVFSAPIGLLVSLFSAEAAGWTIIAVLAFAWLMKVAVGDAFAMTAIVAAYQRETAGLQPDPAMAARLDAVSDKFNEIKQRASEGLNNMMNRPQAAAPQPPAATDSPVSGV